MVLGSCPEARLDFAYPRLPLVGGFVGFGRRPWLFAMTSLVDIELQDVTVAYQGHPAVHHVSGQFTRGSLTCIVGPNGAGKSSLLQALMGMLPLASGKVIRHVPRSDTAYLPQQGDVDRAFPITVLDTVLSGHWQRAGLFRPVTRALRDSAMHALQVVGLHGLEKRTLGSLSAGQFQRTLFARVFAQDCRVIVLDEPFNALDAKTTADLLALLHRWHSENRTLIAVIHDLDQVRAHFPRALLLARECLGWGETHEVLTPVALQKARAMSEGWRENAPQCAQAAKE
jgi:zinc/manganese transport system ATP-binding protein